MIKQVAVTVKQKIRTGPNTSRRRRDESSRLTPDNRAVIAFEVLGKRWAGLILSIVIQRDVRYHSLRDALPITETVLNTRLKELVDAGLLRRDVDEGPPIAVTYFATKHATELQAAFKCLYDWASKYELARKRKRKQIVR